MIMNLGQILMITYISRPKLLITIGNQNESLYKNYLHLFNFFIIPSNEAVRAIQRKTWLMFSKKPSPSFFLPSKFTPDPTYVMEPRTLLCRSQQMLYTDQITDFKLHVRTYI